LASGTIINGGYEIVIGGDYGATINNGAQTVDRGALQRCEKRQHLAPPQLLSNDDLLGRVDPVNLEHIPMATMPDF
jgi:hypothetical protein